MACSHDIRHFHWLLNMYSMTGMCYYDSNNPHMYPHMYFTIIAIIIYVIYELFFQPPIFFFISTSICFYSMAAYPFFCTSLLLLVTAVSVMSGMCFYQCVHPTPQSDIGGMLVLFNLP